MEGLWPCGHAYHDECLIKLNFLCIYCHDYLSSCIDELAKSYNKRLEMVNDIEDESETSEEFVQEDDQLEDIPVYQQLSQKFYKLLTGIFEFYDHIIKFYVLQVSLSFYDYIIKFCINIFSL
jgi:hypothetical protein